MKKIKLFLPLLVIFIAVFLFNNFKNANKANKSENNNEVSQIFTKKNSDTSQEKQVSSGDNIKDKNSSNDDIKGKVSSGNDIKDKVPSDDNMKDKGLCNNNMKDEISSDNNMKDKVFSENNITEKVKNYIINGQGNKSEAQKIKWSKTFLNKVDIESLYKQYIDSKGDADDLESFANYITLNAPIFSDWKELFKKDLYDTYGEKVVRLEHLEKDLYQAYVVKDGSEVPYVVVSSRTGYFHG